jgi:hypothetical protein
VHQDGKPEPLTGRKKQLMNTNTDSAAYTRLLDDLLWLHARGNPNDGLREAVDAMVADYTDDANRYSDGSEVLEFPGYDFRTTGKLHLPPHRRDNDLVAAAREFVRSQGGCVVSISELLDELSGKFGDRLPTSPDTYRVLDLIETLWADPHIDRVPDTAWIEFAWNARDGGGAV